MLPKVTNALDACNIEYVVYDGISGEPTDKMVAEGVKTLSKKMNVIS